LSFEFLKRLCCSLAASGDEGNVRSLVLEEIKDYVQETRIDNLGNLIVKKKGESTRKYAKKILVTAHMDEVGFIIKHVTDEGFLKFGSVGSVDPKVLLGTRVLVGKEKILGVIGSTPIHLLESSEKSKKVDISDMYIDIGSNNKEESLKHVSLGDFAYFEPTFIETLNEIKSKSLDNRLGCNILINLVKQSYPADVCFAFTTKEEVGSVGARAMAYYVNPDASIVVDTTTASDVFGVKEENVVCKLGKGPVVPFMDLGTIYNRNLYKLAFEVAKENNIPLQTKEKIAGGTDASSIQSSRDGTETLGVSVPCRYIHSPVGICKKVDLKNTEELIKKIIFSILEKNGVG